MELKNLRLSDIVTVKNISKKKFVHEFATGGVDKRLFVNKEGNQDFEVISEFVEYVLEPGEEKMMSYKDALEVSYYLSQKVMIERKKQLVYDVYGQYGEFNVDSEQAQIMLEIMGLKSEVQKYDTLTKVELLKLCEERGILGVSDKMKNSQLVDLLSTK